MLCTCMVVDCMLVEHLLAHELEYKAVGALSCVSVSCLLTQ